MCLSSNFPDCGAIFLANRWTREECLGRKLFGLPVASLDFVLKVKRGMLLFLFEYDDRKLYGVFEASSDGGLDLVPNAYKSTKKSFPAQVRFNVFWQCPPLPENVFRDAIIENYITPYKFKCGLSRDQAGSLLFLFKRAKLEIQRSHMSEGCPRRHTNNASSAGESHPRFGGKFKSLQEVNDNNHDPERNLPQTGCGQGLCSLTLVEIVPKSMSKKLASLVVYDPKMTADLDDSIPLPLLEPGEIEDPLLHELVLKTDVCSLGSQNHDLANPYEQNDDNIGYQVHGLCSDNSKPDYCFSGPQRKHEHKLSDLRGRGLNSDSRDKCISVFQRLAGWPKVIEEKSGNSSENVKVIEKESDSSSARFDRERKSWHNECNDRAHLPHGGMASENTCFFSRLGNDVKMAAKSEQKERVDDSLCRSLKHRMGSKVKTRKDGKRKRKHLRETKSCNKLSLVPDLCRGSSPPCKTEISMTKPFICEGDIDEKLDPIALETNCDQDPVEMLIARYKEYLSRSRIEDQTENCTIGVGEGPHEFHSLQDCTQE